MAAIAHEAIRRARISRDAAPLDAPVPKVDVKEPIVMAPRALPVDTSSARPVPIAPSSVPARPVPAPARKSAFPAQAPASRPVIEKAPQASSPTGREPPLPPVPATSAHEAPPFSTLDNRPVDK
jgi:hypothetical protein